jgi:hypothetical protein
VSEDVSGGHNYYNTLQTCIRLVILYKPVWMWLSQKLLEKRERLRSGHVLEKIISSAEVPVMKVRGQRWHLYPSGPALPLISGMKLLWGHTNTSNTNLRPRIGSEPRTPETATCEWLLKAWDRIFERKWSDLCALLPLALEATEQTELFKKRREGRRSGALGILGSDF